MRILIIASDPELGTQLNNMIAPFKTAPNQSLTVVTVVEPSPVVDFTMSASNCQTIFKRILDERMQSARDNLRELKSCLEQEQNIDVDTKAVMGFVVPVTVRAANDLHADLVLLEADCTSTGDMKELLSKCPCSVVLIKPLKKTA